MKAGQVIAERFELVGILGRGAVGEVWLARDHHLENTPVALKLLGTQLADDREAVSALKREILLARRLRHPNILAVYTFWEAGEYRFISMEYADGASLAEAMMRRGRPFVLSEVLPWLRQLCEALDFAHAQGLLHRDVKPSNILLSTDGTVRLADFGTALTLDELYKHDDVSTTGTLSFMSPEQLLGRRLDHRSDQFSLACAMFMLMTGRTPFDPKAGVDRVYTPAPAVIANLNAAANAILARMMARNPQDRYPNCIAAYEELHRAVRDGITLVNSPISDDAEATVDFSLLQEDTVRLERGFNPHEPTVRIKPMDSALSTRRLGDILLAGGVLTDDELREALDAQKVSGEKLGSLLVKLDFVTEELLINTLAKQLRLPRSKPAMEHAEPEALRYVSEEQAIHFRAIPMHLQRGRLIVAMSDPLDLGALNGLEELTGLEVLPVLACESEILVAIKRHYTR